MEKNVRLCDKKKLRPLNIRAGGVRIAPTEEARYPRVTFDTRLSFNSLIETKIPKALKTTEAPKKLLPKTREPSEQRRLFKSVTDISIVCFFDAGTFGNKEENLRAKNASYAKSNGSGHMLCLQDRLDGRGAGSISALYQ